MTIFLSDTERVLLTCYYSLWGMSAFFIGIVALGSDFSVIMLILGL